MASSTILFQTPFHNNNWLSCCCCCYFNNMLELTLERFIIQWLIWIQLIVLLLIFAFLFSFTIIVSDPTNDETAASASASTVQIQSLANHYSTPVTVTNPLHITQVCSFLFLFGILSLLYLLSFFSEKS